MVVPFADSAACQWQISPPQPRDPLRKVNSNLLVFLLCYDHYFPRNYGIPPPPCYPTVPSPIRFIVRRFRMFWLVVVYEITDRQPSKASIVYFIVVILPLFDSNAEPLRLPPAVRAHTPADTGLLSYI